MGKKNKKAIFEVVRIEIEKKVKTKKKNKVEQDELIQRYAKIHEKFDNGDRSIIRAMLIYINKLSEYEDEDLLNCHNRLMELILSMEAASRDRTSELNEILSLSLPLLKTVAFKQKYDLETEKPCDEILYFDSISSPYISENLMTPDEVDEINQNIRGGGIPNEEEFVPNACIAFYEKKFSMKNVIQYVDERANICRYQAFNIFGDSLIFDEERSLQLGGFVWKVEEGLNTEYFLQQIESKYPNSVPDIYLEKSKIKIKGK